MLWKWACDSLVTRPLYFDYKWSVTSWKKKTVEEILCVPVIWWNLRHLRWISNMRNPFCWWLIYFLSPHLSLPLSLILNMWREGSSADWLGWVFSCLNKTMSFRTVITIALHLLKQLYNYESVCSLHNVIKPHERHVLRILRQYNIAPNVYSLCGKSGELTPTL